jgi:hypothetical protein
MAKLDMEQTVAVVSIQQLINDWAYELDVHNGREAMADLLTEDVRYNVGGAVRESKADTLTFYKERFERLSATPEGVPFHRHALSNLRTRFTSPSEAAITFTLVYWTVYGMASGQDHADPAAVADVRMTCRREADGHWRIASFDSEQTFRRVIG